MKISNLNTKITILERNNDIPKTEASYSKFCDVINVRAHISQSVNNIDDCSENQISYNVSIRNLKIKNNMDAIKWEGDILPIVNIKNCHDRFLQFTVTTKK